MTLVSRPVFVCVISMTLVSRPVFVCVVSMTLVSRPVFVLCLSRWYHVSALSCLWVCMFMQLCYVSILSSGGFVIFYLEHDISCFLLWILSFWFNFLKFSKIYSSNGTEIPELPGNLYSNFWKFLVGGLSFQIWILCRFSYKLRPFPIFCWWLILRLFLFCDWGFLWKLACCGVFFLKIIIPTLCGWEQTLGITLLILVFVVFSVIFFGFFVYSNISFQPVFHFSRLCVHRWK